MINIQNIDFDGTYGEARAKNSKLIYILPFKIKSHLRAYSVAVRAAGLLSVGSLVRFPLSSNVCYVCVIFAATQIIYACCNSTMRIFDAHNSNQYIVTNFRSKCEILLFVFMVLWSTLVLLCEFWSLQWNYSENETFQKVANSWSFLSWLGLLKVRKLWIF
jgi:hypothetical protein